MSDFKAIKRVFGFVKLFIEFGVVSAFLYFCIMKWGDISHLLNGSDAWLLVVSAIVLIVAQFMAPFAARQILSMSGVNVPYIVLCRIHMLRLPAKYIPGGIWHTVGRAVDLIEWGVSKVIVARLFLFENLFAVAVAATLGVFARFLFLIDLQNYVLFSFLSVIVPLFAFFCLCFYLSAGLRKHVANARVFFICVATYVVAWFFLAAGFVIYFRSIYPSDLHETVLLFSSYLLAWVAGFFAIFSPQGLGVFEYVFATFVWGEDVSASMLVVLGGYRILFLLIDLLLWLVFRFFINKIIISGVSK